jgi:hypothetical protein
LLLAVVVAVIRLRVVEVAGLVDIFLQLPLLFWQALHTQ